MSDGTGRVYAQLTGVAAIWGGTFVAVQYALAEHGPMKLAAIRYVLATLVLFPLVWRRERRDWWPLILTGFLSVFVYQTCFFQGMSRTGAVNGALVISANPMMTAFLAAVLLRERLRPMQWLGIALSFAGECVVISRGSWHSLVTLDVNRGDLLLLVAVLSWALNSLYIRRLGGRISPLVLSAWSCLFGGLFLLPFGWFEPPTGFPGQWSWLVIAIVLYLAVPSTAITSIWWYDGIEKIGPSRTAIFVNLVPVFAMLFALLTGKVIEPNQLLGAALVICGVYLTTRRWGGAPSGTEA
jgi:drug/metabolite transporter (DMT)-like permease